MSEHALENLNRIEQQLRGTNRWLYCSDCDGTLADLVDSPEDADLTRSRRALLQRLARRFQGRVAIISGRNLDEVRKLVGVEDLIYAGNHGLEIAGPSLAFIEPAAATRAVDLERLCRDLEGQLDFLPGVKVEYKGLTATVHHRPAEEADQQRAAALLAQIVDEPAGLFRTRQGNGIIEILPRISWNKGSAVLWLAEQLEVQPAGIIYLGNDSTDEDAFAALPGSITIRIGPAETTEARWYLSGPAEVEEFLNWLGRLSDPSLPATDAPVPVLMRG
jgi:trehalose 6-phosphate phosphatase